MHTARHVIGCHLTQEMRAQNAFDDVASIIHESLANGGNCEAILRHSNDEGNPNSSTIGCSFMNWRGDLALGGNAMSSITLGRVWGLGIRV